MYIETRAGAGTGVEKGGSTGGGSGGKGGDDDKDDFAAPSPPLSAQELVDLRIATGARVVSALCLNRVAGAVAQTHLFDYRITGGDSSASNTNGTAAGIAQRARSHFGAPPSCLEVKVVATPNHRISDEGDGLEPGELVVAGPAVVGGEARTGVIARFGDDSTVSLA